MAGFRRMLFAVLCALAMAPSAAFAQGTESERDQKIQAAAAAHENGAYEEAVGRYTAALSDSGLTNDRRAQVLNDRAVAFASLGRISEAFVDFNESARLFPENASVYNNRGAVLLGRGLTSEAIKDFDRALLLAPGYVAARNNRATAYAMLEQPEQAVGDFTRALKLSASDVLPLTGRARVLLAERRPHAALRDLDHALGIDGRNAEAYRLRAEARLAVDDVEAAIEDLSRAAAFQPEAIDIYLLRGKAYMRHRDVASAILDFSKVIELDARRAEAWRERAHANVLVEAFEAAEADITRALELDPRAADAFAYRALMYKKMGRAELGEREIVTGLSIDAGSARVLWAQGEIAEALGRIEDAAQSYRSALRSDPQLHQAIAALDRVAPGAGAEAMDVPGPSVEGWRVVIARGRYKAVNDSLAGIEVPIEMAGEGDPRLVSYESRMLGRKRLGLLTFIAGVSQTPAGSPYEYVAVIDLSQRSVAAMVPSVHGGESSTWTWGEQQLTVAALDGLTDRIDGGGVRSGAVADGGRIERRREARRFDDSGVPAWAPWATNRNEYRRPRPTSRRRKPKTLFDLLLGN